MIVMAKDPVTIFTITHFFTSDPGSVQKGIKAYDADRVEYVVKPCGLFLSNSGIIGASPDGLIPEQRKIVEIKCPWFARKMTLEELLAADGFYMEFAGDGSVKLKSNHNYFHQVQGCMHLSDTDE